MAKIDIWLSVNDEGMIVVWLGDQPIRMSFALSAQTAQMVMDRQREIKENKKALKRGLEHVADLERLTVLESEVKK